MTDPILETDRLILRPPRIEDLDPFPADARLFDPPFPRDA